MSDQTEARELLALLGLTEAQIEAALNGTLEVKTNRKVIQPTRKKRVYKEYLLSRTTRCRTCHTTQTFFYHMKQMEEGSGLVSSKLTEEEYMVLKLPVQRDWAAPATCEHCMENLMYLDKTDLGIMLLDAINERERCKNGK